MHPRLELLRQLWREDGASFVSIDDNEVAALRLWMDEFLEVTRLEREAMNQQPIETARDPDLRLSLQALQRAAQRAWELAAQTGTAIVVSHGGVIEHIRPSPQAKASWLQDPPGAVG